MQLSSLAPCLATFPHFLLLFLKWLRAFISKQVASERDGGKKSHWNLNWLSMLCGSPLKRETNRGSCWVTWPTRLMCASGEDKEKRNNPFETPALSLLLALSVPLNHSPQWSPSGESRYDACCKRIFTTGKETLAYTFPLVAFESSSVETHWTCSVFPCIFLWLCRLCHWHLGC